MKKTNIILACIKKSCFCSGRGTLAIWRNKIFNGRGTRKNYKDNQRMKDLFLVRSQEES